MSDTNVQITVHSNSLTHTVGFKVVLMIVGQDIYIGEFRSVDVHDNSIRRTVCSRELTAYQRAGLKGVYCSVQYVYTISVHVYLTYYLCILDILSLYT